MAATSQEIRETTEVSGIPVQTTSRTTTTMDRDDTPTTAPRRSGVSTAERLIYFITGLLATILAFRFVLSLLGANRSNSFADLIYGISYPFVAPFFGLFGYKVQYDIGRFDIETLVAIAVYSLIGYGIAHLVRIGRRAN